MRRLQSSGFTLVELLVVISIIGILAGLVIVNLGGIRERARDTQRKNDLRQIKAALRLYFNDFQQYPQYGTANRIDIDGGAGPTAPVDWGTEFSVNGNLYMDLPIDPVGAGDYQYKYWRDPDDGDVYCLWAKFENISDEQISESQQKCSSYCSEHIAPGGTTDTSLYFECNR